MLRPRSSSDKRLLFCDLDGTLIYSHRHTYDGRCVWVERLHDRPQSFMTEQTYRFFRGQQWLHVIPLTTRDHAQFERLRGMAEHLHFSEALICNGAVLLHGMQEDAAWRDDSLKLAEPFYPELQRLEEIAEALAGTDHVIRSDPFLFYVRSADAQEVFRTLAAAADPQHIHVWRDARKVYCIPHVFSKANAAKRCCKRLGAEQFMAAGDGEPDIPLLFAAQTGFCPDSLKEKMAAAEHVCLCGGWFSDTLCSKLEQLWLGGEWN